MITHHKEQTHIRLYRLVAKSITPLVLLVGLLLLALYHFHAVLSLTQAQSDLMQGITAFSQGRLELDFQRDAGIDRPAILYDGLTLISYTDSASLISVDGHVQGLWDNLHGYSVDQKQQQLFATTSGQGWQVTEVITLVNAQTVTVTYQFTARHIGTASPQRVALSIAHAHSSKQDALWFYPNVQGSTFTAEELPPDIQNPQVPYDPNQAQTFQPLGTTTLAISGPAVASNAIVLNDVKSALVGGVQESWASTLTTNYLLPNPKVDEFVTLGTETITFQPAAGGGGTPIALPVPTS